AAPSVRCEQSPGQCRPGAAAPRPLDTGISRISGEPPLPPSLDEKPAGYAAARMIEIPALRPSTGSNMPKTQWLLYAENRLAPFCRKLSGSITPEDDTARANSSSPGPWWP